MKYNSRRPVKMLNMLQLIFIMIIGPILIKGQQCNTNDKADIVFILDGSGSVGASGFTTSLDFAVQLTRMFQLGQDSNLFGLVIFSDTAVARFYLNQYTSRSTLEAIITGSTFPSSGTATSTALDFARTTMFTSANGKRNNALPIAILITDGMSNNQLSTLAAAENLRNAGVTIYGAWVGSGANMDEIEQIASDPAYVFNTSSYDTLIDLTGPLAQTTCEDLKGCFPDTCYNGGTCSVGTTVRCTCLDIYYGYYCQTSICKTPSNPCLNGATCSITGSSVNCQCSPGFTGTNCEVDIDECISDPCVNGTCIDGTNSYYCDCDQGYTGSNCEIDINECASNPCVHGTCHDLVAEFSCTCDPGWTGVTCNEDIDECLSDPCENGGTCFNGINYFLCDCPSRYYGIFCETGICQPSVADILFVLDSSSSQTSEEFSKQLAFINKFIDHVVIGENDFNIGVITFSFTARVDIPIGQHQDNVTLKEAVSNITFRPGATYTNKGIDLARTHLMDSINSRPYNKTAKRYVFVLTDGLSTYRRDTRLAAERLRNSGFANKVLAIGIGPEVSHQELLDIASPGDHRSAQYVFSVNNFNALYSIVTQLVDLTCDECYWNTTTDLVFLLDASVNMAVTDFEASIEAMTYLLNAIIERDVNSHVRMGLLSYGKDINVHRTLLDQTPTSDLIPFIQTLGLRNQFCEKENTCNDTALLESLEHVQNDIFNDTISTKESARQIVIFFSNGHFVINNDVKTQLEHFKQNNISMISIAVGDEAKMTTLQEVVDDPAFIYFARFREPPTGLDAMMGEIFYSSCELSLDF